MTAGEIDLLAEQFRLFMDPKFIYILEKEIRASESVGKIFVV